MKGILSEFEELMKKEINEIDARIQSEKYNAPESYINDLKGFSRGASIMGHKALKFFREKLMKHE